MEAANAYFDSIEEKDSSSEDDSFSGNPEVYLGAESDGTMEGTQILTIMQQEDGSFVVRYYFSRF